LDTPAPLTDPSYDTDGEHVRFSAAPPGGGDPVSLVFPAEDAGKHLHGWLTTIQDIAERSGAVGLGEVAQKMIVLQPTELAMASVGPGKAAIVFAFGPVKLAFLVSVDQLAGLVEATRRHEASDE
jgi:hypothetical protein